MWARVFIRKWYVCSLFKFSNSSLCMRENVNVHMYLKNISANVANSIVNKCSHFRAWREKESVSERNERENQDDVTIWMTLSWKNSALSLSFSPIIGCIRRRMVSKSTSRTRSILIRRYDFRLEFQPHFSLMLIPLSVDNVIHRFRDHVRAFSSSRKTAQNTEIAEQQLARIAIKKVQYKFRWR